MTVTVKNKIPLTVPDRVRRWARFKPGDKVEFKVSGGIVTIRKLSPLDKEYTPAQRRVIDARLDEAEKGAFYGPFNTVDDMIAHLELEVKRRRKLPCAIDTSRPFPCFALPEDAEPITLEQVLEAEDG